MNQTNNPQPVSQQAAKFAPLDPAKVLKQNKNLILLVFIISGMIAAGGTFMLARVAPQFRATAKLEVIGTLDKPDAPNSPEIEVRDLESIIATQVALIPLDQNLLDVLQVDAVKDTQWYAQFVSANKTLDTTAALKAFKEALDVRHVRGSRLIDIRMTCKSANDARSIANAVANEYVSANASRVKVSNSKLVEVFTANRSRAQTRLEEVDRKIKTMLSEPGLDDPQARNNEADINFKMLTQQKTEAEQMMKATERAYEQLLKATQEGNFQYSPQEEAQIDEHPFIRERDNRIIQLTEQRIVQINRFGENHRSITDIDLSISATRTELEKKRNELLAKLKDLRISNYKDAADSAKARYLNIEKRLEEVRAQKQDISQKINELNKLEEERLRTLEEIARHDSNIASINTRRERPDANPIRLSAPAITPNIRYFPKYETMIPAFVIISLMFTIGVLFVREILDQRIKSPACKNLLPPCDLLGVIPEASEVPGSGNIDRVVGDDPQSLLAESFRKTRTQIMQRMDAKGHKTLMVVGSQPQSGTTMMTANMGISMAMNQRRVLIIDANLRRPRMGSIFGVSGEGLCELLSGSVSVAEAIHPTEYEGLSVIPVGMLGVNTFELLEGAIFSQLLNQFKAEYDFILIDTPPLAIIGDGAQLANTVDATCLVVRALNEKRGLIARMINQLNGMKAQLTGMVFNGIRTSSGGYFRRNYQDFYDYQQAPGRKK